MILAAGHDKHIARVPHRLFLRYPSAAINHPDSGYVCSTEEMDGVPVIAMELVGGLMFSGVHALRDARHFSLPGCACLCIHSMHENTGARVSRVYDIGLGIA